MRSLQTKLSVGLLLSLIAAFALLWIFVSVGIRYLTEDYIYNRLAHDAETLLAAITPDASQLNLDNVKVGAVYQQPFSGHYFVLEHEGETLRSRSLWDLNITYEKAAGQLVDRQRTTGPQSQPLLVLVSQFVKNEQPVTIVVAEDFAPVEAAIAAFRQRFSMIILPLLILLVLWQIWLMRRGLQPIKQVQQDLVDLEAGKIRSLQTDVPQELIALVNEINHLHGALESRLKRHRDSLSDLAHALKTPLTVIQQVSQDKQLSHLPDIAQVLQRQAETTTQLIQRILNRARLAGSAPSASAFDFSVDFPGLLQTLQMMYRDKSLVVNSTVPEGIGTRIDAQDMLELLGNLLDNACKWARHEVSILVSLSDSLNLTIEDDGPGIPEDAIDTITRRGGRLDERVEGHGMGLAIVGDIVECYQGELRFSRSMTLGGLAVQIKLPV
ncbi:MAG: sensor histidine kinase [Hahellaceae bacterium]|nr:sensor histidine kinase [Hahellaceae bacterium]MCP5168223.1 sensor histidine kinase [Hahellaceae bacterium]